MIITEQIKKILSRRGYRITGMPYHVNSDIKSYKSEKDAVDPTLHFTIISPKGHVVGRLHKTPVNSKHLSAEQVKKIAGFFTIYRIKAGADIKTELESLIT